MLSAGDVELPLGTVMPSKRDARIGESSNSPSRAEMGLGTLYILVAL